MASWFLCEKNHTSQTQVPTCMYNTYVYNQMWLTVGFDVFIYCPLPASSAIMYWLFIFRVRSMWNGRADSKWVNSFHFFSTQVLNHAWNIVINHKNRSWIYLVLDYDANVRFGWVDFTSGLEGLTVSGKNRFSTISALIIRYLSYFYLPLFFSNSMMVVIWL